MWPPGVHRGSRRNPLEAILVDRATRCGAPVGGEVAEQDRLGRRCCVGHVRVDHYRTTENRKVASGTEPVDQILSVDFQRLWTATGAFLWPQDSKNPAPALCPWRKGTPWRKGRCVSGRSVRPLPRGSEVTLAPLVRPKTLAQRCRMPPSAGSSVRRYRIR